MNHKNMKTILVDAVYAFVVETENGFEIFEPMRKMLDEFPNMKIILTSADDEQFKRFGLAKMPYEVFSLKHHPEKTDTAYYEQMLDYFGLDKDAVIYFEHDEHAVKSAQSAGIVTYHYDHERKDLGALRNFLTENV